MTENPLKQYFRQPAIHLTLPSGGEFYPNEALEMPETGEVPVYPMTAIDEITYKTPDALFNGSAIVDVVKSCIPAIKDPWLMPTIDLNSVLISIRIASFGERIDVDSTCPKCNNSATYEIDCRTLLDKTPDINVYHKELTQGDLIFRFRPLVYKEVNENNKLQFEESRLQKLIQDESLAEDQKIQLLTQAFQNIAKFSIETIAKSISSIQTPESLVVDRSHIEDFLKNCESELYERIKKHLFTLKEQENLSPLKFKCTECEHEYEQAFALDMTSFFARNS